MFCVICYCKFFSKQFFIDFMNRIPLLYGLYFLSVSLIFKTTLCLGLTYLRKTYFQRINFQTIAQTFTVDEFCSSLDVPIHFFNIIQFHIFQFDEPIYVHFSGSLVNAGDAEDIGSIPGSRRSPGVGNGNRLQ